MPFKEVVALARFLLSRLPRRRVALPALVIGSVLNLAAVVLSPIVTGSIIDALAMGQERGFIRNLAMFLALVVIQLSLMVFVSYGISLAEEAIGREIRNGLVRAFFAQRRRDASLNMGDITTRVVSDSQSVQSAFSSIVLQPSMDLLTIIVAIVLVSRASLLAGALLAVTVPCSVLVNRALAKRLEHTAALGQITIGGMIQALQAWLARAPWVHIFGVLPVAEQRVFAKTNGMFNVALDAAGLRARISVVGLVVMLLPQLLILAMGGRSVLDAEMTLGALVSLLGLASLAVPPLSRMVGLLSTSIPSALPSFRRVTEPLADLPRSAGPVERFERVDVLDVHDYGAGGYSASEPFVSASRFIAHRGEIVCLRGSNGSGKTTFVTSLIGLVAATGHADVHSGDGSRPLSSDDVAFSPAEPIIFDGTTEQNLYSFAAPRASAASVLEWTALAGRLEAQAVELSRGELTKLMVARALLVGRPVLILDEPTLGLDALAVQELVKTLRAAARRGPVVVITHDDRLLAAADRTYETRPLGVRWQIAEMGSESNRQILSA